jgi:hypothetical protein
MTRKIAAARGATKSSHSQIRNQNSRIGNRNSPVMQKVRSLLPAAKAAQHLAILIDEPLGNCQKLLCGERTENAEQLRKILRSWMGREVLLVVVAGSKADWIVRYRKQIDANRVRKQLADSQRALDALQAEMAE